MTLTEQVRAITPSVGFDEVREALDRAELRFELIDGCIVMTPPPGFHHEHTTAGLLAQLHVAAPEHLVAMGSNFGFYYDEPSYVLPDVSVSLRADCDDDGIRVPPLLVVEVLSPSTRRRDRGDKQEIYAEAGVPTYWLVDPVEPSLTVLELQDGAYVQTARTTGTDPLEVSRPFNLVVRLPV